jgi:two-component system response regulator VicR
MALIDKVEMDKPTKTVIYFEDDKDMVELVRIILGREGYQINGVAEGQAGIIAVQEEVPDVVLLDLMMPDMDGWEIYQQLKHDDSTANIPVIVITAKTQRIDKVLGLEIAKVDDYISKPFTPQELIERVGKVISSRKN